MSQSNQDANALEAGKLLPLVYDELRRLAAAQMARDADGHTLDATALVHEAFRRVESDTLGMLIS